MRPVLSRLTAELERNRRRTVGALLLRGAALSLTGQAVLLPILAWISSAHPYDPFWIRAMVASYALYAWPLLAALIAWWRGGLDVHRLAENLDRGNPGSPDVFRTLLSLGNHDGKTLDALDRYFGEIESSLRIPRPRMLGNTRRSLLFAGLAFGVILPGFSGRYTEVAARILNPISAWNHRTIPSLEPVFLPKRVVLGDTLRVQLRIGRLSESEPVYALLRGGNAEFRFPLQRKGDSAWFRHGPVQSDLALRFSAAGVETQEWIVRAVPPPHLENFSAVILPPAYAHAPPETLATVPASFAVLAGSKVTLRAETSEPVKALARLREGAAAPETLDLGTGRNFVFTQAVKKPLDLRLRLVSVSEDAAAGWAGPYRVEITPDAPPEIVLLAPSADQALGRALKVPVLFRARDDFGIARVQLRYSVFGEGLRSQGDTDVTTWLQTGGMGGGIWDLAGLDLYPGNTVEMHLEAEDNDAVSGPQNAHSETVRLRMPSLEEVLTQVGAEEQGAVTSLRSAAERGERMRREQESSNPSSQEGPPPLGEWEVERILVAAPRQHLQRLRRHLDAEAGRAARASPLARQLQGLAREAEEMEKHLPLPNVTQQPFAEQQRKLEALTKDQEKLQRDFSTLKPLPAPDRLDVERKRLGEELNRNLQEQKDLNAWLQDKAHESAESGKRMEQSAQAEERMREDVRQAMEKMQSAMEKARENGVLSPDVLEKMDRIRDLLKEALPDSALQKLRENVENQRVGLDELQRNLGEMLERGENLREGLDRAIRMLEMMRDMRGVEELAKAYRAMEGEERKIREPLSQDGAEDASRSLQAELRRRLEKKLEEQERLAGQKGFESLRRETGGKDAAQSMREVENSLQADAKNRGGAARNAEAAAASLGQAAEGMEAFLQRMQGGPDPAEIAALLEETLEFTRWLDLIRDRDARSQAGWWEENAALYRRVSQATQWLRGRLEKLAARRPFESEALRREAGALGFHSESDSLLVHARRAARELLKWLDQSQQEGSSGGSGMGSQAGGSGSGGMEGLSGRLRGISGKQMAVNQATQDLLRSFMQGRNPGSAPGGGGGSGERGEGSSRIPGSSGKSGAAGSQQQVGEALERMAESEGDAGGAARKLRQLAEEARDLESALRGRVDVEEVKRRQDRFQTRLLEAANALEERGKDRRREAEAFRGVLRSSTEAAEPSREGLFRELKRRQAESLGLGLSPEQRRHLEWYYGDLLTR